MCLKLIIHRTHCETRRIVHPLRSPPHFCYDIYHPLEPPGLCEHWAESEDGDCAQHGKCCTRSIEFVCDIFVGEGYFYCLGNLEAHLIVTPGEENQMLQDHMVPRFAEAPRMDSEVERQVHDNLKEYMDRSADIRGILEHLGLEYPRVKIGSVREFLEKENPILLCRWEEALNDWSNASLNLFDCDDPNADLELFYQYSANPCWYQVFKVPDTITGGPSPHNQDSPLTDGGDNSEPLLPRITQSRAPSDNTVDSSTESYFDPYGSQDIQIPDISRLEYGDEINDGIDHVFMLVEQTRFGRSLAKNFDFNSPQGNNSPSESPRGTAYQQYAWNDMIPPGESVLRESDQDSDSAPTQYPGIAPSHIPERTDIPVTLPSLGNAGNLPSLRSHIQQASPLPDAPLELPPIRSSGHSQIWGPRSIQPLELPVTASGPANPLYGDEKNNHGSAHDVNGESPCLCFFQSESPSLGGGSEDSSIGYLSEPSTPTDHSMGETEQQSEGSIGSLIDGDLSWGEESNHPRKKSGSSSEDTSATDEPPSSPHSVDQTQDRASSQLDTYTPVSPPDSRGRKRRSSSLDTIMECKLRRLSNELRSWGSPVVSQRRLR